MSPQILGRICLECIAPAFSSMFTQRAYVDAYGYEKIGSRVSRLELFSSFLLVLHKQKRNKRRGKIGMYFKNERIKLEKNQSNLIGLLVDSLNYEPHSHVLPYSETHWGQILSSNRI